LNTLCSFVFNNYTRQNTHKLFLSAAMWRRASPQAAPRRENAHTPAVITGRLIRTVRTHISIPTRASVRIGVHTTVTF